MSVTVSEENNFLSLLLPVLQEKEHNQLFKFKASETTQWTAMTYGDFDRQLCLSASHWSKRMTALGLPDQAIVGVWLTGGKYVDLLNILGLSAAGYVPQLFSVVFPNPLVIWDLLVASGAQALVIDPVFSQEASRSPIPTVSAIPLEDLVGDAVAPTVRPVTQSQTAFIVHSSGTTSGFPKVIPQSHGWLSVFIQYKYPGALKQGVFDERDADVTNTIGSLAHVGAFTAFLGATYAGFCTLKSSSMGMPTKELVDMITTCGLNRVALYASFLSTHIKAAQKDPAVLFAMKNCRQILCTGVALDPEDEEWARENGLPITTMYGTSETAPTMTSILGDDPSARFLRIITGSSAQLTPYSSTDGDEGSPKLLEIVLPLGALDSPHASLYKDDHLFHTGDLFEEIHEGLYKFRGRYGDWLKTLGGFIDTRSVEDNARKACGEIIHDVVVLGSGYSRPALFVESREDFIDDNNNDLAAEIVRRLSPFNQRLFLYERIDNESQICILPKGSLPRTKEKGNVRRNEAEKIFAHQLRQMCGSERV